MHEALTWATPSRAIHGDVATDDAAERPTSGVDLPAAPRRITLPQLREATAREAERRTSLEEQLRTRGIAHEEIERFLSQQYGGPYGGWSCDLSMTPVDPAALAAAPRELCVHHRVLPIARTEQVLAVVVSGTDNVAAIEALRAAVGLDVMWGVASEVLIDAALRACSSDVSSPVARRRAPRRRATERCPAR